MGREGSGVDVNRRVARVRCVTHTAVRPGLHKGTKPVKTIEELWDEAAKAAKVTNWTRFKEWSEITQDTITRFAELVRADCQAVPTERPLDVYNACRLPYHGSLQERGVEWVAWFERVVERARSGPSKQKTPGERLREWVRQHTDDTAWDAIDWEAEAAKLIGGNDG